MKYWGFFIAKLGAAGAILYGLWLGLVRWLPEPQLFSGYRFARFGQDLPWTLSIFVYSLFAVALVYVAILDQRYRCRSCLRRLRMPVQTGSWARITFFGPPKTEYICLYGHGTLKVPELQISGMELPDWKPHQDIWKELEELEAAQK
jgi:hypothetical protein